MDFRLVERYKEKQYLMGGISYNLGQLKDKNTIDIHNIKRSKCPLPRQETSIQPLQKILLPAGQYGYLKYRYIAYDNLIQQ